MTPMQYDGQWWCTCAKNGCSCESAAPNPDRICYGCSLDLHVAPKPNLKECSRSRKEAVPNALAFWAD